MKKLRAVYYCRVSTDDENQATSIVNQQRDSLFTIDQNGWELIDAYIDEGKSGTTTKSRDEYNRLVSDISTDKFDVIVCKSQDRLNRNTFEWYNFTNIILNNDKKLYFYLDRKYYNPDEDALITGITAIMDESYSRNLSKKINNAHRRRQESGTKVILTNATYGYDKINKQVVINEPEAEMVRKMFELATQNYGTSAISKILLQMGYTNRNGKMISDQTVRKIIRNPLYKGVAVMNKAHKDFNTKKVIQNPESEWIYREGLVPPIVDSETWDKANKMMDSRSTFVMSEGVRQKIIGTKNNTTSFTGKIKCGLCGSTFWRRSTLMRHGRVEPYWLCSEYAHNGRKTKNYRSPEHKLVELEGSGCDNIHFKEVDLKDIVYRIAQRIYGTEGNESAAIAKKVLEKLLQSNENIRDQQKELNEKLSAIESKRKTLLDRYLDDKISDDIYQSKDKDFLKEIDNINNEISQLEDSKSKAVDRADRINRIEREINEIADVDLSIANIMKHIETIMIYPDKMIFSFDVFDDIIVDVNRINYKRVEYNLR